jgi:hypothetical protein
MSDWFGALLLGMLLLSVLGLGVTMGPEDEP